MSTRNQRNDHESYSETLSEQLIKWLRRKTRPLRQEWLEAALVLLRINLDPVRPMLESLYAPNPRGGNPFDHICLLRALLLMVLLKLKSIPQLANELTSHPRLAGIAGFDPDDVPVAGTLYLFLYRLEDGPYQKPCSCHSGDSHSGSRVKPSSLHKGKHQRDLPNEKQQHHLDAQKTTQEYDSITQKLTADLLAAEDQPRPNDLQKRLEDILIQCGLIPSAERALLGDTSRLRIAGDGSVLPSAANPHGTPTCDCWKQGKRSCDCDRLYTDPTANWGYDSYRECYYFGHTYYQHVLYSLLFRFTQNQMSETKQCLKVPEAFFYLWSLSVDEVKKVIYIRDDEGWIIFVLLLSVIFSAEQINLYTLHKMVRHIPEVSPLTKRR